MKNNDKFLRIWVINLLLVFSVPAFAQLNPPENFYVTPVGMASWDSIQNEDFQFYKIFLDGVFVTDVDSETYQFGNNGEELVSGEIYLAEISALYNDGLSQKVGFEFVYLPCDSFPNYLIIDAYNPAGTNNINVVWSDSTNFIPIYENFEYGILPPEWTMITNSSVGWFISTEGSSENWEIPEADGYYACSNDDAANDDGSMDYLITPEIHFVGLGDIQLSFSSFLNGEYGETGTVEISLDDGISWIVIEEVEVNSEWTENQVDLSAFSGEPSVRIAFHANDNGEWATGWAVDNISISAAKGNKEDTEVIGTNIFMDDELIGFVPAPDTFYIIEDFSVEGFHDICVSKIYSQDNGNHYWSSCNNNLCIHDIGFGGECNPPGYLFAEFSSPGLGNDIYWESPSNDIGLLGYKIYRDSVLITENLITENYFHDNVDNSTIICYYVTAVYSFCDESESSNEACCFLWAVQELNSNYIISPNPAQTSCKIQSTEPISSITIYNQIGQKLKTIYDIDSEEYQLNIYSIADGIYFMEIVSQNKSQLQKFIIQH